MTGWLSRNTGPIVELAERELAECSDSHSSFRETSCTREPRPCTCTRGHACVRARDPKKKMRRARARDVAERRGEGRPRTDAKGKGPRRDRESARDNLTTVYRRCLVVPLLRPSSCCFVKIRARENHAHQGRGHPPFPRGKCTHRLHRRRGPVDPAANAATKMTGCLACFQGRSRG